MKCNVSNDYNVVLNLEKRDVDMTTLKDYPQEYRQVQWVRKLNVFLLFPPSCTLLIIKNLTYLPDFCPPRSSVQFPPIQVEIDH